MWPSIRQNDGIVEIANRRGALDVDVRRGGQVEDDQSRRLGLGADAIQDRLAHVIDVEVDQARLGPEDCDPRNQLVVGVPLAVGLNTFDATATVPLAARRLVNNLTQPKEFAITTAPFPDARPRAGWPRLNWPHVLWWSAIQAGVVLAPFAFSWSAVVVCLALYLAAGFGVTMGYHRLLTHRSFRAHSVVKFVLLSRGKGPGSPQ